MTRIACKRTGRRRRLQFKQIIGEIRIILLTTTPYRAVELFPLRLEQRRDIPASMHHVADSNAGLHHAFKIR